MKAVNEMKSNKKDGTNMLISENIIHGTHKLYVLLSLLFTSTIIHGYCPVGMITGTMIPIPKIKGTVNSDQFRAITLSSLLGKMFDMILLEYFKNELLSSQLQFGFKQNYSTAMCSYLVQEVISHYESSGNSVFCIMLDASKAFDRLQFCKLFNELRQKSICPLIIRVLIFMYTNQLLSVKWDDKLSKSFKVLNGVKQGGVLSPVLFCLYLDVLLNKLYHTGVGCYLGPYFCGALAYADDVILLSPTVSGAKSMLNVCAKFSSDYNVKFNASKSNVIIFGKSHILRKHFKLNNVELPQVNNAKHLGHMISNLCSGYIDISTIIQSFNKSVNILIAEFGFLQSSLLFQLFLKYCCSLYGVVLCNIYTKSTENLKVAWRKAIRRIYKISPRTHNKFLPLLCNNMYIEMILEMRIFKFYQSILKSKCSAVKYVARCCLYQSTSNMGNNISNMQIKYSSFVKHIVTNNYNKFRNEVMNNMLADVNTIDEAMAGVCMELIEMRDGMMFSNLSTNECMELINEICTI